MAGDCELGVTGLATMGANLARNAARNGFPVAVHNRTASRTQELLERHGDEGELVGTFTTGEFVAALALPRRILVMVKAGPAVDVLEELAGHLDEGDLLIDGGNSWFEDTVRREQAMAERGLRFLGTGVSGGEEGALNGPSIMPGGSPEAYGLVERVLTTIAAQVDGVPCCRRVGPDGAGHYVKMVHNGIEYADMQLIAEAYDLLGQGAGMGAAELADVFERWNAGDLDSFLIEITAKVLRQVDQATGQPLVDVILDQAEQKGTGRWTVQSALELGVPVTGITEAVFARVLSSQKEQRTAAAKVLQGPSGRLEASRADAFVDDVRDALYASKVVAYAQGFEQIAAASEANEWNVELGGLATIWRGGCIIRARFLDRIREAYEADPGLRTFSSPSTSATPSARPRTPGGGSRPPPSPSACRPQPSPRRWPTTTASGASADRPTCSRASATSSAPTPTGGSTAPAPSTPSGPRTAGRSTPDPAPPPGRRAGARPGPGRLRRRRPGSRSGSSQTQAGTTPPSPEAGAPSPEARNPPDPGSVGPRIGRVADGEKGRFQLSTAPATCAALPSLRTQLAQLLLVGFPGTRAGPVSRGLVERGVGGLLLFRRNVVSAGQVRALVADLKGRPRSRSRWPWTRSRGRGWPACAGSCGPRRRPGSSAACRPSGSSSTGGPPGVTWPPSGSRPTWPRSWTSPGPAGTG